MAGVVGAASPYNHLDLMMSGLVTAQFSKILSSDTEFTPKKMMGALLVLSLDELVTVFKSAIRQGCQYIRQNHHKAWIKLIQLSPASLWRLLCVVWRWMWTKRASAKMMVASLPEVASPVVDKTLMIVNIKFHSHFLVVLARLVYDDHHCSYISCDDESVFDIKDKQTVLVTEKWKDIVIVFEELTIKLTSHLSVLCNKSEDGSLDILGAGFCGEDMAVMNGSHVTRFLDLLPNTMKNVKDYLLTRWEYWRDVLSSKDQKLSDAGAWKLTEEQWKTAPYECCIIRILHSYFPQLDRFQSLVDFCAFVSYSQCAQAYMGLSQGYYAALDKTIKVGSLLIFDHVIPVPADHNTNVTSRIYLYRCGEAYNLDSSLCSEFRKGWTNYVKSLIMGERVKGEEMMTDRAQVMLSTTNPLTSISDQFQEFLRHVNSSTSTVNSNKVAGLVAVNLIRLVRKTTTVSRPNPEYSAYMERVAAVEGEDKTQRRTFECPPQREISDKLESVEVVSETKSHQRKSFDTLYLREDDSNHLKQAMDLFLNNKTMMLDLGLPYKFSALLYGIQGCGKSSTVNAIGSYMNQSINFVDLSGVQTNNDLQMIFDHVNKHSSGGILVIEEIDKQTDIVLKCTRREDKTGVAANKPEEKVTLSYLLNILQGCLTTEGQILICTSNYIDHLAPEFYRDGRFDVRIEMKPCDRHQISQIFRRFTTRQLSPYLLDRVIPDKFTPASVIQRLAQFLFRDDVDDEVRMQPFLEERAYCPFNPCFLKEEGL